MDATEWMTKLEEYCEYFRTITLPAAPIKIDNYATINDVGKYIEANIAVASQKPGSIWFEGATLRLEWLKNYLSQV